MYAALRFCCRHNFYKFGPILIIRTISRQLYLQSFRKSENLLLFNCIPLMYSVIPHLKATPTSKQLIVHGQPFLIRGAELQNSSFPSTKFMREL